MNIRQKIINAAVSTVEEMRPTIFVPNPSTRYKKGGSTGNMAFDALEYKIEGDIIDIYIDDAIAPYCYYTDEPWVSNKWKGKKNPNEGWWKRFCEEFSRRLAVKLRGELK